MVALLLSPPYSLSLSSLFLFLFIFLLQSPLGFYFVTGSHDKTARVWSTDHIQPLRILAGHLSDVDVCPLQPYSIRATRSNLRMVRPSLMSVVKLSIICARSMRHKFGPIFNSQEGSHFTSASNWELPLLCSLSLACTERMCAHLYMLIRLYPAGFYYSSSVWERDKTKVERIISYIGLNFS